jgi:hypothetical protein
MQNMIGLEQEVIQIKKQIVIVINMSLKIHHNKLAFPNSQEELYVDGQNIIGPEMERLMNLSWEYNLKGKGNKALRYNKAANMYSYIFYLALFIRNYAERKGWLEECTNDNDIEDKYGISCLKKELLCIGSKYKTNYLGAWEQLVDTFGLDQLINGCCEDCEGISEMIISGNDCDPFVVTNECTNL